MAVGMEWNRGAAFNMVWKSKQRSFVASLPSGNYQSQDLRKELHSNIKWKRESVHEKQTICQDWCLFILSLIIKKPILAWHANIQVPTKNNDKPTKATRNVWINFKKCKARKWCIVSKRYSARQWTWMSLRDVSSIRPIIADFAFKVLNTASPLSSNKQRQSLDDKAF